MAKLASEKIRQEASELHIAKKHFGAWTNHGFPDVSCTLHSVGMSYWTFMGIGLGYESVTEMPAPCSGPYGFVGGDVRSDCVWFDSRSFSPRVLTEFERYSGALDEAKLYGKVQNLLLAHHRWGPQVQVLVLAYWTKGLATLPDHDGLRSCVRNGFETTAKERVVGVTRCDVLFFQMVMREAEESRWCLSQVIERGVP